MKHSIAIESGSGSGSTWKRDGNLPIDRKENLEGILKRDWKDAEINPAVKLLPLVHR
jgi:hypothetical protein